MEREVKYCVVCGKELNGLQQKYCSLNCKSKDFYKNKNKGNASYRQLVRYLSRKLALIDYKGSKCEKCGYDRNISALEFHHIDSSTKIFNIDGRNLANRTYEELCEESDKCMLLCSNCHKEIHNSNKEISIVRTIVEENKNIINKHKEIKFCKDCGKILLEVNKSGYCAACYGKHTRKVERPTKEELSNLLANNSLNKIGKMYGVTHAAIKKWAVNYGLINERKQGNIQQV